MLNLHQTEKYFLSSQNFLLEVFAELPIHINYLNPSIEKMTILYFSHSFLCNCY